VPRLLTPRAACRSALVHAETRLGCVRWGTLRGRPGEEVLQSASADARPFPCHCWSPSSAWRLSLLLLCEHCRRPLRTVHVLPLPSCPRTNAPRSHSRHSRRPAAHSILSPRQSPLFPAAPRPAPHHSRPRITPAAPRPAGASLPAAKPASRGRQGFHPAARSRVPSRGRIQRIPSRNHRSLKGSIPRPHPAHSIAQGFPSRQARIQRIPSRGRKGFHRAITARAFHRAITATASMASIGCPRDPLPSMARSLVIFNSPPTALARTKSFRSQILPLARRPINSSDVASVVLQVCGPRQRRFLRSSGASRAVRHDELRQRCVPGQLQ
jgi:hypothetical protein